MKAIRTAALVAATTITLVTAGCGSAPVAPQQPADAAPASKLGRYYPEVKSFCDPDVPGIRVYVSEVTSNDLATGAGGGAVAVIADANC